MIVNSSIIRTFATPIVALIFWLLPIRVGQKPLMTMAFLFWLIGGIALTIVGAKRLTEAMDAHNGDFMVLGIGLIIAVAIGLAKGRFVLSKTSKRNIERLQTLALPAKLIQVYSVKSWIIIEIMLLISASLTWFGADPFWRGLVNVAVGLALLMSSLTYLQSKPSEPTASTTD